MGPQIAIRDLVTELGQLCQSGYSAALHFGFHSPDFLFQAYPAEWREEYSRDSLVVFDPALRWGMENQGSCRWSDLPGSENNMVMERARAHGLAFGFVTAIGNSASRSILNCARADREFTDEEIKKINGLFDRLHVLSADLDDLDETIQAELRADSIQVTRGVLG